jgi:hypothetical protein
MRGLAKEVMVGVRLRVVVGRRPSNGRNPLFFGVNWALLDLRQARVVPNLKVCACSRLLLLIDVDYCH